MKLAEFGQQKPVEIRPVESLIKSYETMKSIQVFIYLTLELALYLYIETRHRQSRKNSFLVIFQKQLFEATS